MNAVSAYYVHPRIDHRGPAVCPGVFIAGFFWGRKTRDGLSFSEAVGGTFVACVGATVQWFK